MRKLNPANEGVPLLIREDQRSGRSYYFLALDEFDAWPTSAAFASPHFALFCVGDATSVSADAIGSLAEQTIAKGVAYVSAWGPDCSRVHDIFDEVLVMKGLEGGDDDRIMTSWHDQETLEEALWYFLNTTIPDDAFLESCRSWVAVSVGGFAQEDLLRYLEDPKLLDAIMDV